MIRVAVYGRSFNESFIPYIQEFFDRLSKHSVELYVFEAFNSYLRPRIIIPFKYNLFNTYADIASSVNYMISIGGDGSLLDTVSLVRDSGTPILGINTGRLGFLSNVAKTEIEMAINALVEKNYHIDQRSILQLNTSNQLFGDFNFAMNELTIHKKDSSSMVTVHAYINNEYLNSYWADGIIIATPTGSTAYSLSCGGPIVFPGSQNFVITPIAPHNLNVRPVVLPDSSIIRLKVEGRSQQFLASLDSRSQPFDAEVELIVKKADYRINLIQLEHHNFFTTIRNKLNWGIDKRN